jgi:hypothetical protein
MKLLILILASSWLMGCESDNMRACSYACRDGHRQMRQYDKGKCECTDSSAESKGE